MDPEYIEILSIGEFLECLCPYQCDYKDNKLLNIWCYKEIITNITKTTRCNQ